MAELVGVLDYGIGNIRSIVNALAHVGAEPQLVNDPARLLDYNRLIVPGVGAFARVYAALSAAGFREPLLKAIEADRSILGICVGMQILFEKGLEFDGSPGLGVMAGSVRHISEIIGESDVRLPVIGWRDTMSSAGDTGKYYFLHSYAANLSDTSVLYETYELEGKQITASVVRGHLSGTQYHPERSGKEGLAVLSRFVDTGSIKR